MSALWKIYDVLRDFYLERFYYNDVLAPFVDLNGKTFLITGGNAGLGLESAIQLARMGPEYLIITSRSLDRGNAAKQKILKESGISPDRIRVEILDLCSLESVTSLSKKLLADKTLESFGLSVLMCNAGVGATISKAKRTEDGFDEMFQGNNLGHFLLTLNLLPLLTSNKLKEEGRIINLSSLASKFTFSFDLEGGIYNNPRRASGEEFYPVSKLMSHLAARGIYLTQNKGDKKVLAYAVHPGTVNTEFADKFTSFTRYIFPVVYWLFERPIASGAATQVLVASSDDAQVRRGGDGSYWSSCQKWQGNLLADNDQLCKDFVNVMEGLIQKHKL